MATNTLKPISSAAIRQRMEELQARRREFMKRNPPQWISKQKIIQHVLGAEMVSLSRESDFAKLPAEMQLSVISFMDYPSVLKLKQTCRYFNFFINADVLRDSKQYQIDQYQDMEKRNRLPPNRLPCYTCLHLQPMTEFYNITSNFYYGSQPTYSYNYNRAAQSPPLKVWDRCCIRCNFMKGNYNAGLALTTKGETWMFCGACGHLVRQHEAMGYGGYGTCKPCSNLHNFLKGFGPVIRCMQLVVAIVILPLACTGQAMPWSSTPDSNSLRWIFMVTLDLLTIGGTFASWCVRAQGSYGNYNHKRTENHRFNGGVEWTACVCWVAVLIALFNDGRRWHFEGRWDRFAKGLAAMTFIECLMFIATALMSTRWTQRLVLPGVRVKRDIV